MKNKKPNWDVTNPYKLAEEVVNEVIEVNLRCKDLDDVMEIVKARYINWEISLERFMQYQDSLEKNKQARVDRGGEIIAKIFNSPMYKN